MTRLARLIVPGLPHHVTQRGNRREAIFFEDGDQEIHRDLLAEQVARAEWLGQEVVVDQGLVTSRKPDDIPAFNPDLIKLFASARGHSRRAAAE